MPAFHEYEIYDNDDRQAYEWHPDYNKWGKMPRIIVYESAFNHIRRCAKDLVDCFFIGQFHTSFPIISSYAVYKGINFKIIIQESKIKKNFRQPTKFNWDVVTFDDCFIQIIEAIVNSIDTFDFSDCTFLEGSEKLTEKFLCSAPAEAAYFIIEFCKPDSKHPEFESFILPFSGYTHGEFPLRDEYWATIEFYDNQRKLFETFLSETVSSQKRIAWIPEEQRTQEERAQRESSRNQQTTEELEKIQKFLKKIESERTKFEKEQKRIEEENKKNNEKADKIKEEQREQEKQRQELDKIETLVIDEGTEVILPNAYKNLTNLKEVVFPSSLKEIRTNAFLGCTGITSITLPKNLTKIDAGAFFGCTNLKHIEFGSLNITLGMNAFGNIEQDDEQTKEKISAISQQTKESEDSGLPPYVLVSAKNGNRQSQLKAAEFYEKNGNYKEAMEWYKKVALRKF